MAGIYKSVRLLQVSALLLFVPGALTPAFAQVNTSAIAGVTVTVTQPATNLVRNAVTSELPFGDGKRFLGHVSAALNQLVGGWQLNLIPSVESGVTRSVTSPNTCTIAYITQRANATGINPGSSFTINGVEITPGLTAPLLSTRSASIRRWWTSPAPSSARTSAPSRPVSFSSAFG